LKVEARGVRVDSTAGGQRQKGYKGRKRAPRVAKGFKGMEKGSKGEKGLHGRKRAPRGAKGRQRLAPQGTRVGRGRFQRRGAKSRSREFFINNLLVRNRFIIVMIRWTGLAPWEFELPQGTRDGRGGCRRRGEKSRSRSARARPDPPGLTSGPEKMTSESIMTSKVDKMAPLFPKFRGAKSRSRSARARPAPLAAARGSHLPGQTERI